MNINQKLTRKKIEEHEFEVALQGYDPEEVDAMLDNVIADYEAMETALSENSMRMQELVTKNSDLNTQVANLTAQNAALTKENERYRNDGYNNLLYTKRISNLEKKVDEISTSSNRLMNLEKILDEIRIKLVQTEPKQH